MNDWTLLPTLVLRSAGFPWQLLDGLAWTEAAAAADELRELTAQAERMRDGVMPSARLTRGQAARLRGLRPLDDAVPVPADWLRAWNELSERVAAARDALTVALEKGEAAARTALDTVRDDARFLDAVVCSGPGVYRELRSAHGRPPTRRLARQIGAYLQRFAAKCETMSFFGPINYAEVDPRRETTVLTWGGPDRLTGRRAFASAWIWAGLRDAAVVDPALRGDLVPRRKTLRPDAARATLRGEPAAEAVHAAADGRRSLRELAGRTGLTPAEAAAGLVTAVRLGVLACAGLPDDTEPDPVRRLAGQLPEGSAVARRTAEVIRLLDRYPQAPPDTKLEILGELPRIALPDPPASTESRSPTPGPRFYNDRSPVHEAAVGDVRLTIGGGLARDLQVRIPAALDLLAHCASTVRTAANAAVAGRLGPGRFRLVRVLRDCAELEIPADDWLPHAVRRAIAATPGAGDVDLAGTLAPPPAPDLPVLGSVDVMVATGDLDDYAEGRTPLVLGDVHDAPLLTPWALQFHAQAEAHLARRDEEIMRALGDVRAVSVVARRSSGLPPLRLPGPLLELGTVSGAGERVHYDELYVHSDGKRARLRAAGRADELFFHNGELDNTVHTAFALPRIRPPVLPDLPSLPRLRWGNVVVARRRWTLGADDAEGLRRAAEAGTLQDRFVALRGFLSEKELPGTFFAKAPHERKPVYVDTSSPLLLDGLVRLARDARELRLSEVLPGPRSMWLRHGEERFAAELRCVYLRKGKRS